MVSFFQMTSGRLVTAACGIALLGGGIASLAGETYGTAIMCMSIMASVITTVFAMGIASNEKPGTGILAIIALPFLMFMYVLLLGLSMQMHAHTPGYIFAVLGLLAISRAIMIKKPVQESRSMSVPVPAKSH